MSSPSGREAESYIAPVARTQGEIREKGSRFLACLEPVGDEDQALAAIEAARREHRDATHVCWAWRLGAPARERSADAGEPPGTAGLPILQVLRGAVLSDVLLLVVRWFGGTKLGKGGLARAYAAAAKEAVELAELVERIETVELELSLPYPQLGAVRRLLDGRGHELVAESYEESVHLRVAVERPRLRRFEEAIADLGPTLRVHRINETSS